MNPIEAAVITALGAALDPLPAFVLLWPALLHRRWWPLVLWCIARTALTAALLNGSPLQLAAVFLGSLAYMTAVWGIAKAVRGRAASRVRP
ncbi:MAG: hypothetical protein ACK4Z5_03300 [Brevundimonas sp.]